jgi:hypothetical protein
MVKSVRRVYQTMAHRDVAYVGRLDAWDRANAGPMVVEWQVSQSDGLHVAPPVDCAAAGAA